MPHLFRVTNPHGETWYMDADGCEITKGEAIIEAMKRRCADPEAERKERKKLWSIRHDCRVEEEYNPSEIEEIEV